MGHGLAGETHMGIQHKTICCCVHAHANGHSRFNITRVCIEHDTCMCACVHVHAHVQVRMMLLALSCVGSAAEHSVAPGRQAVVGS